VAIMKKNLRISVAIRFRLVDRSGTFELGQLLDMSN
jgi:hypothetical protein